MPRVSAIVLAAGLSTRMAPANKLLIDWHGQSMIRHVVSTVLQTAPHEVIVVTGHMRDEVTAALDGLPVRTVDNPQYHTGMGSSLACGARKVSNQADAVMVCLGDMPEIRTETLAALHEAFADDAGRSICVPSYHGARGHPVLFARRFLPALVCLAGDAGAKPVLEANADDVYLLEMDDPGILLDIDTARSIVS